MEKEHKKINDDYQNKLKKERIRECEKEAEKSNHEKTEKKKSKNLFETSRSSNERTLKSKIESSIFGQSDVEERLKTHTEGASTSKERAEIISGSKNDLENGIQYFKNGDSSKIKTKYNEKIINQNFNKNLIKEDRNFKKDDENKTIKIEHNELNEKLCNNEVIFYS